jgi:hypothetical protein
VGDTPAGPIRLTFNPNSRRVPWSHGDLRCSSVDTSKAGQRWTDQNRPREQALKRGRCSAHRECSASPCGKGPRERSPPSSWRYERECGASWSPSRSGGGAHAMEARAPAARPTGGEDVAVMQEAAEHGADGGGVAEQLPPVAHGSVGSDQRRCLFVASQVRRVALHENAAEAAVVERASDAPYWHRHAQERKPDLWEREALRAGRPDSLPRGSHACAHARARRGRSEGTCAQFFPTARHPKERRLQKVLWLDGSRAHTDERRERRKSHPWRTTMT